MALRPLIAVCGSTGVGKSDFAVELARKLFRGSPNHRWQGARIINADCTHVYAGLDVVTNKITEPEMKGVEHLLMGFKQPGEPYFVSQWVQDAMKAIDETYARNQIPIVTGGTIYWIQRLMFANRLESSETPSVSQVVRPEPSVSDSLAESLSSLTPKLRNLYNILPHYADLTSAGPQAALDLHHLLSVLDPAMAARWHWKDTRKVLRSLRTIQESGRRLSEIASEQTILSPRYRTLCFWVYAQPSALRSRLDARVDRMIERGLLDEINALREIESAAQTASSTQSEDSMTEYTDGLYQTIGYKEFREYLTSPERSEEAFNDAISYMKQTTRKYAKGQVSWLRNKLLPAVHAANVESQETGLVTPTYLLDATDRERWNINVLDVGQNIAEDFLAGRNLPDPKTLSEPARKMFTIDDTKPTDPAAVLNARRRVTCPVCSQNKGQPITLEAGQEWELHQNSRKHKKLERAAARLLADNSSEVTFQTFDDTVLPLLPVAERRIPALQQRNPV